MTTACRHLTIQGQKRQRKKEKERCINSETEAKHQKKKKTRGRILGCWKKYTTVQVWGWL